MIVNYHRLTEPKGAANNPCCQNRNMRTSLSAERRCRAKNHGAEFAHFVFTGALRLLSCFCFLDRATAIAPGLRRKDLNVAPWPLARHLAFAVDSHLRASHDKSASEEFARRAAQANGLMSHNPAE